MTAAASVDVFEYRDYRDYLRDYYVHRKAVSRSFSYRSFARRAGLGSPNYLKLVIDGQRNLSRDLAPRFADACNLDGDPKSFFVELVAFRHADGKEREQRYSRITSFHRYRKAHRLEVAHAEYVSNWYTPAIRELALHKDFRPDPKWIASYLRPTIRVSEARRSLQVLQELGFLVPEGETLVQRDSVVSTGPEVSGVHIHRYHREMIGRSLESLNEVASQDRDISALSLCVSKSGQEQIKKRIQAFRKELLAFAEADSDPDRVLQLNFQMFPLSETPS